MEEVVARSGRRWLSLALILLLAWGAVATFSGSAFATATDTGHGGLRIRGVYVGGRPPGRGLIAGGGNLRAIFDVAAKYWESAFSKATQPWNITIYYGWGPYNGFGQEKIASQGGNPHRILSSLVTFSNTPPEPFFADPHPGHSTAYRCYTSTATDTLAGHQPVLGGPINVGRVLKEPRGDAVGRVDLLTTAEHEIGHALGLDTANTAYSVEDGMYLPVTSPRPHAGTKIVVEIFNPEHLNAPTALMVLNQEPGERKLITGVDILADAQISGFDHPILDPGFVRHVPAGSC